MLDGVAVTAAEEAMTGGACWGLCGGVVWCSLVLINVPCWRQAGRQVGGGERLGNLMIASRIHNNDAQLRIVCREREKRKRWSSSCVAIFYLVVHSLIYCQKRQKVTYYYYYIIYSSLW